jgi:hypothetical protein
LDEFAGFRGVENLVITDERAPVSVIRRFHIVENGEQDRGVLQAGNDRITAGDALFEWAVPLIAISTEHRDIDGR